MTGGTMTGGIYCVGVFFGLVLALLIQSSDLLFHKCKQTNYVIEVVYTYPYYFLYLVAVLNESPMMLYNTIIPACHIVLAQVTDRSETCH